MSSENIQITSVDTKYTLAQLSKLKLTDLKLICKEQKLPVSGTKQDLINKILGTTTDTKKIIKSKKEIVNTSQILKNLEIKRNPIIIKKNKWGNFEHLDTNLIFSNEKKVIGKQSEDGNITALSASDLDNVHKYYFELDAKIKENKVEIVTDSEQENLRIEELINLSKNF